MNYLLLIYLLFTKIVLWTMGLYILKLRKDKRAGLKGPIGYMCTTDLLHELSWGEPGVGVGEKVTVFDSIEGAQARDCTKQCGITKVVLVTLKQVQKTNWRS